MCLRVQDPLWEQRGLCPFSSGSGIELHYCVVELGLLHTSLPSPGVGSGTGLGMCLQVGRAAVRLEQAKEGTATDTSWP